MSSSLGIGVASLTSYSGYNSLQLNGTSGAIIDINKASTRVGTLFFDSSLKLRAQDGASIEIGNLSGTAYLTIGSTGAITSSSVADAVGYKGVPQNSQTAAYVLALTDMGKHISITTGGITIPANGTVAFPIGSAVTIFNNSGSSQTIAITTDTLRQAGTANTGSRTLAQYGVATVLKVTSTVWVISGAGLS